MRSLLRQERRSAPIPPRRWPRAWLSAFPTPKRSTLSAAAPLASLDVVSVGDDLATSQVLGDEYIANVLGPSVQIVSTSYGGCETLLDPLTRDAIAGAISQGVARALKDMFGLATPAPSAAAPSDADGRHAEEDGVDNMAKRLRDSGFLTRDSRMKERKKYGRKGARKSFQFSKR